MLNRVGHFTARRDALLHHSHQEKSAILVIASVRQAPVADPIVVWHRETTRGKRQMSYVQANLVPGEKVIYETRLHWIVMLGHLAVGCLLLALPGALLLYYARNQSGIDTKELHLMECGAAVLLISGVAVIVVGMVRRKATGKAGNNLRVWDK